MLKLLPVGQAGLNTDLPQWDLPPEVLTEGRNFRITEGHIEPSGGLRTWVDFSLVPCMGKLTFIPSVNGLESDILVAGTTYGIWAFDGTNKKHVLSIDPPLNDPYGWTFCRMGSYLIMNHPEIGAFYWYPAMAASAGALPLPFEKTPLQPDGEVRVWNTASLKKSGEVLRSHKNFLFMMNLKEEYDGKMYDMPDSFRWSHPADVNSIPVTWDVGDQFFMAGMASLGTDSGFIVDGMTLRDNFVIYSSNGINRLDLSGDEFVWRRSSLTTTANLLSKDCVVECKGNHFLIVNGDIVLNNGNAIESIVHNRVRRHFNANISTTAYKNSFAVKNDVQKEVWLCVPQQGSETANLAYIYNWKDDTWAIKDLPVNTSSAVYGSINNKGNLSWKDYGDRNPPTSWQGNSDSWGSSSLSPFNNTIVGCTLEGRIDDLDDSSNDVATNTYFERQNYPLEGHRQVTTLVRAYPHISGFPVRIRFGAHDYAGAPVRWYPNWIVFDPNKDRKIDFRVTGELIAWRIESIGTGRFQYSGMDVEYALTGQR